MFVPGGGEHGEAEFSISEYDAPSQPSLDDRLKVSGRPTEEKRGFFPRLWTYEAVVTGGGADFFGGYASAGRSGISPIKGQG